MNVGQLRRLIAELDGSMAIYLDDGHNAWRARNAEVIRAEYADGAQVLIIDDSEPEETT